MDSLQRLLQQAKLSKKAIAQVKEQNSIFNQTLQEAIKGAPESDKKQIEEIRLLSNRAIQLAKEGRLEEAQNLIKEFQNGGKDNQ